MGHHLQEQLRNFEITPERFDRSRLLDLNNNFVIPERYSYHPSDESIYQIPRTQVGSRASSATASLSSSPSSPTYFLRDNLDTWHDSDDIRRPASLQNEITDNRGDRADYFAKDKINYGDGNIFSFEQQEVEHQQKCLRCINSEPSKFERFKGSQETHQPEIPFYKSLVSSQTPNVERLLPSYPKYANKDVQTNYSSSAQNSNKYNARKDLKNGKIVCKCCPSKSSWNARATSSEARVHTNGITGQKVRIRKCVKNWEKHATSDKKVYPESKTIWGSGKPNENQREDINKINGSKLLEQYNKIKEETTREINKITQEGIKEIDNDRDETSLLMSRLSIASKPEPLYLKAQDHFEHRMEDDLMSKVNVPIAQCCKMFEDELKEVYDSLHYLHELQSDPSHFEARNNELRGYFYTQIVIFRNKLMQKVYKYEEHLNFHMNSNSRLNSPIEFQALPHLDTSSLSMNSSNSLSTVEEEKQFEEKINNSLEDTLRDKTYDIWGPGELGLFAQTPRQLATCSMMPFSSNPSTSND